MAEINRKIDFCAVPSGEHKVVEPFDPAVTEIMAEISLHAKAAVTQGSTMSQRLRLISKYKKPVNS